MIPTAPNSTSLLNLIADEGLYLDLLQQLIKDFQLSGLSISLDKDTSPTSLLEELHLQIKQLIHTNFDGLLQILYRVDIPEQSLQSHELQDSDEVAKKATFMIIEREWKKVYFRNEHNKR